MHAVVDAADVQDRDGVPVMATLSGVDLSPLKRHADGGHRGPAFQAGVRRACRGIEMAIVKRSAAAKGFTPSSRRWIVERAMAS